MNFFFQEVLKDDKIPIPILPIVFRNGYSANSPSFIAKVSLSIGTGKAEWGAERGVEYYVLRILEVME